RVQGMGNVGGVHTANLLCLVCWIGSVGFAPPLRGALRKGPAAWFQALAGICLFRPVSSGAGCIRGAPEALSATIVSYSGLSFMILQDPPELNRNPFSFPPFFSKHGFIITAFCRRVARREIKTSKCC